MSHGGDEGFFRGYVLWTIKTVFNIHDVTEWAGDWGISRGFFITTVYAGMLFVLWQLIPSLPLFAFNWLAGTAPIWLPVAFAVGFWRTWIWYVQSLYISGRNPILLEVKVPREISRSPRAMEMALSNFWISSGETTFIHRAWKGQVRPWFSLEYASFGGDIHMYVWTWKNYAHTVEEAIYGAYPGVEIFEVEDYASKFDYDENVHTAFACEWRLEPNRGRHYGHGKFDSVDAYPLRSYIDYELDKDPKEEFKIDPLSSVFEFLSSAHPWEQIWVQLVIRRCGKYGIIVTHERDDEWKHGAVEMEAELIRAQSNSLPGQAYKFETYESLHDFERESNFQRFPNPSPRHKQMLEALDRQLGKLPFEFVGRGIYISDRALNSPTYTHLRWMWKPIGNSVYLAQLRPRRGHTDFDYPWQDAHGIRYKWFSRRYLDAYRRRSAFHSPWITPSFVLTNESLATMWRPVSSAVTAPGLQRIAAKKAEPPPNLPH